MRTDIWTDQSIKDFWQDNQEPFAGDLKAKVVIRLTKEFIKGRKLDVGAGSGSLIDQLSNTVGVDIIPKHPLVVEGSIASLPFEASEFDTVFATDVIEHLPDETLRKGLKEIRRVMSSQANLIAVIPYKEDFSSHRVYCPNCKSVFHRWGHLQSFDEAKVRKLFEEAGLHIQSLQLLPLPLMAGRWWLWRHWKLILASHIISKKEIFARIDMLVVATK